MIEKIFRKMFVKNTSKNRCITIVRKSSEIVDLEKKLVPTIVSETSSMKFIKEYFENRGKFYNALFNEHSQI